MLSPKKLTFGLPDERWLCAPLNVGRLHKSWMSSPEGIQIRNFIAFFITKHIPVLYCLMKCDRLCCNKYNEYNSFFAFNKIRY